MRALPWKSSGAGGSSSSTNRLRRRACGPADRRLNGERWLKSPHQRDLDRSPSPARTAARSPWPRAAQGSFTGEASFTTPRPPSPGCERMMRGPWNLGAHRSRRAAQHSRSARPALRVGVHAPCHAGHRNSTLVHAEQRVLLPTSCSSRTAPRHRRRSAPIVRPCAIGFRFGRECEEVRAARDVAE